MSKTITINSESVTFDSSHNFNAWLEHKDYSALLSVDTNTYATTFDQVTSGESYTVVKRPLHHIRAGVDWATLTYVNDQTSGLKQTFRTESDLVLEHASSHANKMYDRVRQDVIQLMMYIAVFIVVLGLLFVGCYMITRSKRTVAVM